jgi:mannonate dehydratase
VEGIEVHLALTVQTGQDDQLILAQQLGVDRVFLECREWTLAALTGGRHWVEQTGLRLAGVESLPRSLYARAVVGLPGREAQVEQVCQVLREAGEAGIPQVGYRWTPPGARSSERVPAGRGESLVSQQDTALFRKDLVRFGPEKIWANLEYFLERVIPVAQKAGVRLACHPDDPPVASIGDAACVLSDPDGLTRLLALSTSPWHGLDLCLGCLAAMPGVDAAAVIAALPPDRLLAVHLRNVQGDVPRYRDAFLDEGDLTVPLALRALHRAGYRGPLRADQPPGMVEDTSWGHKGRAYDLGYLRAILQVLGD